MQTLIAKLPSGSLVTSIPTGDGALSAANDIEAINTWLKARATRSDNTLDSYRREALRLLVWMSECGLTLREMKVEDAHKFYEHLGNPPKHWLRPRKAMRDEKLLPTQLLAAKLSAESISRARKVLCQMSAYLQNAGYVPRNIFHLSTQPPVIEKDVAGRSLDLDSWSWLWSWITRMPRGTDREVMHAIRARWVFALLYHTGIRRDEAAAGKMSDFVRADNNWRLRVVGKGRKERLVTVNSSLLQELVLYRTALELTHQFPVPGETLPLISSVYTNRHKERMSARSIGLIVSDIGEQAAAACPDEHMRARITAMSTHWMRHTNATHRLLAGAGLETTQEELGHKDPKTTRVYAAVANEKRRSDAEKLAQLSNE
jgi:integrase/recombinase XerC